MPSLQFRLGSGLLISLLVVFLVLWLIVSSAIRDVAQDYIATRLLHDSETLLSTLTFSTEGAPELDGTRIDTIYKRPFSGHYYQVMHKQGSLRSRSLWDDNLPVPMQASGVTTRLHLPGPQQQPLLVLASGYTKQDQPITIVVAEDLSAVEADVQAFQYRFGITAAVMLILLGIANIIMVRTGLLPLKRVRDEVRDLEHGQRQQLSMNTPAEIAPVVNEVNHLLQILQIRLQRSRHALGDLAHALKKPLTVLHQIQHGNTLANHTDIQQELAAQTDAMQKIIDHVLRRARLAGDTHAGTRFDITRDLSALIDAVQKMYRDKPVQIDCEAEPGIVIAADREDMLELLGNLLDNACKWARRHIRLSIDKDTQLVVRIEDDGPGIDSERMHELSQRGKRLDESVEGHGLGLAIVQDIVEQYRGKMTFSHSKTLGGLQVVVVIGV